MCRSQFDKLFVPSVDKGLQEEIKTMFPDDFEERKDQLSLAGLWISDRKLIKFQYGNLHSREKAPKVSRSDPTKKNMHRWMMYVSFTADKELTDKFVESVTYHLHPTFKPSVVKVTNKPFILSRLGWGYFEVHLEVQFKAWTKIPNMKLDHMLSFDKDDTSSYFFVEVESEGFEKDLQQKIV